MHSPFLIMSRNPQSVSFVHCPNYVFFFSGIQHAVGGLASKPERDLLMQDFMTVETINFPSEGSNHTPAHHFSEFKFKNYAPIAFRYFRDLFGIQPDDFLVSLRLPLSFFCDRTILVCRCLYVIARYGNYRTQVLAVQYFT